MVPSILEVMSLRLGRGTLICVSSSVPWGANRVHDEILKRDLGINQAPVLHVVQPQDCESHSARVSGTRRKLHSDS